MNLPKSDGCDSKVAFGSRLRIAWNFVQAKLHRSYPCGRCGYRYDCPDGECHS